MGRRRLCLRGISLAPTVTLQKNDIVISANPHPSLRFAEVFFIFSIMKTLRSRFGESLHALSKTRTITTVGLLLSIQMVLSSYGVIEVTDSLKISLAHLALAPTAILFGPVAAGLQGALSDILGFILKPTGPYFPGFTLTAGLLGVIYGIALYKTKRTVWHVIAARTAVCLLLNITLNTVFLTMLYGPSRLATLPLRIVKNLIQLPIDCLLLSAMCKAVNRLPKF